MGTDPGSGRSGRGPVWNLSDGRGIGGTALPEAHRDEWDAPCEPVRRSLSLALWHVDPLDDLFDASKRLPLFRDARATVGGRQTRNGRPHTVAARRRQIEKGLHDLDSDIVVLVGAPRRRDQLQRLFDTAAPGTWICRSVPRQSGLAMAFRVDRRRFREPPAWLQKTQKIDQHDARTPRSERDLAPLLARVVPTVAGRFRLLAMHVDGRAAPGGVGQGTARDRLIARCRRMRACHLETCLTGELAEMPLLVCGAIEGTAAPAPRREAVETLMGSVWQPELILGNALFDGFPPPSQTVRGSAASGTDGVSLLRPSGYLLYSRNAGRWVCDATVRRQTGDGLSYDDISAHLPVTARILLPGAAD